LNTLKYDEPTSLNGEH